MKDDKQTIINELSKEPLMVVSTAYLYAKSYTEYGEDITKQWLTATQQSIILEKAYQKGFCDALKDMDAEKQTNTAEWIAIDNIPYDDYECSNCGRQIFCIPDYDIIKYFRFCPTCGSKMKEENQ